MKASIRLMATYRHKEFIQEKAAKNVLSCNLDDSKYKVVTECECYINTKQCNSGDYVQVICIYVCMYVCHLKERSKELKIA